MRASVRETSNTKSASMSAASASNSQAPGHIVSKIQDKLKCVFFFRSDPKGVDPISTF